MQPGETISPGQPPRPDQPQPDTPAPAPATPQTKPPLPVAPAASQPLPAVEAGPAIDPAAPASPANPQEISWTASEYLIHHKTPVWFALLGLGSLALAGLVWLVTQDLLSVVVVSLVAVIFGIAAARQPRSVQYRLAPTGLSIGDRFYGYHEFKSFSVIQEGPIRSVELMPLRRFSPGVSIYYPPEQENEILELLADYLPHEERRPPAIDRLMHKVRY